MAARDLTPPKLRKLSVIVPVFNERNTVVEVLRRMRAVELPDGIEREIIVVDDGSSDGPVTCCASSATAPCASSCTRAIAARARRCAPGSRSRRATTSSSRTPTSSTTPKTGRS